jgi:predicted O-methyltransferase YrrM
VAEVIIATDASAGEDDFAWYASSADRVLRFEFSGGDMTHSWLTAEARGDWLLWLDGNELASSALIDALPELVADRRIGQYLLPRRWSWPDSSSYLVDEPWGDDREPRLFRNDGRTLFPGRPHLAIVATPHFRVAEDAAFYHLDLLLSDERTRRAKADFKDALRFGLMTESGRPFNHAWYVPEDRPSAATKSVDESDRLRIHCVLSDDPQAEPRIATERVRRNTAAEAESRSPKVRGGPLRRAVRVSSVLAGKTKSMLTGRAPGSDAYRAEIEFVGDVPRFAAKARGHQLWIRVRNSGSERWPGDREHPPLIRVGARWRAGEEERRGSDRAFLPHPLEPGEETILPIGITAPEAAGSAELAIDLVHEGVGWFETPVTARLRVVPSAADSLSELDRRRGPLVPLQEVLELRAYLGRRDAFVPPPASRAAPQSLRLRYPSLERILASVELGVFSLDGPAMERVADAVAERRPAYVAEFGSGTSTLVLACLLAEMHGDAEVRLLSFDQDAAFAGDTRAALAAQGVAGAAAVVVLPLGHMPGMPPCYQLTREASALLRERPPELILVDGPTLASGASRLGVLDLIAPFAAPGALILLDDALRDAELRVGQEWAERADTEVLGIRLAGKGMLEARIRAR